MIQMQGNKQNKIIIYTTRKQKRKYIVRHLLCRNTDKPRFRFDTIAFFFCIYIWLKITIYIILCYVILLQITRSFVKDSPAALRNLSLFSRLYVYYCCCDSVTPAYKPHTTTCHVRRGIFKKRSTEPNKKQVASAAWTTFYDETPAHIRNRADT